MRNTFRFDSVWALDLENTIISFNLIAFISDLPWSRCTHSKSIVIIIYKFSIFQFFNFTFCNWAIDCISVCKWICPVCFRCVATWTKVIIFDIKRRNLGSSIDRECLHTLWFLLNTNKWWCQNLFTILCFTLFLKLLGPSVNNVLSKIDLEIWDITWSFIYIWIRS